MNAARAPIKRSAVRSTAAEVWATVLQIHYPGKGQHNLRSSVRSQSRLDRQLLLWNIEIDWHNNSTQRHWLAITGGDISSLLVHASRRPFRGASGKDGH